jgi:hypothetical protein
MDPQQVAAMQQALHAAQQQNQHLQAQLQHAMAAAQNPPPVANNLVLTLKPPKPNPFTGSPADKRNFEDWLFSLESQIAASPVMPPDDQQIRFVASYLKGTALKWWRLHAATHTAPGATYHAFVTALRAAFAPHNALQRARDRLDALKQTTSVTAYNNRFREILLEIPNMQPEEQLHRYLTGLKTGVKRQLLIHKPPDLDSAMAMADRIDETGVEAAGMQQTGRYRPWFGNNQAGPAPMEIGAMPIPGPRQRTRLTPQQREYLLNNNGCLYCRRLGHTIQQCRARPPPRANMQRQGPPQGNARRRSN